MTADDVTAEDVTAEEWTQRFAAALGVPAPTAQEVEDLLALAGTAAHASERTAAPVSCWLAARAGMAPAAARALADELTSTLGG